MATTYKDYYLHYNGVYFDGSTDNGLTAVNCYYNGVYFGEGARTIPTAGKYCDYNFTVGNHTIATAGKYCDYNFQITTQNRYRWYRYHATMVYARVNNGAYSGTSTSGEWHFSATSVYYGVTSYSFDSSTGNYTLAGAGWKLIDGSGSGNSSAIVGVAGSSEGTPTVSNTVLIEDVKGSIRASNYSPGGYRYFHYPPSYQEQATIYKWSSAGSWAPGSYIDVVSSTDSGAYPSNGTWDGVYWYVAI